MSSKFDLYRVLRERTGLKLDALCGRFDQFAIHAPRSDPPPQKS
jgi:hypothetical protein